MSFSLRHISLFCLACLVLPLSACGKKTMPVPPQDVLPAAITDLRYHLDEKGVTLLWTYPYRTEKGARLDAVEGFEILRAVVPAEEYCPGCPVPFGAPITVPGGRLPGGSVKKVGRYTESILRPGHIYFYKVRSKAAWHLSSRDSNTVSIWWDTPVEAPSGLEITAGDKSLTLSWHAPENLLDGRQVNALLAYRIYRGRSENDLLLLGDLIPNTSYTDSAVENGKHYFYRVRAVREYRGTRSAGMASALASGTPRDLTPPVPPLDVKAIKTAAGIKIVWAATSAKDLGGYRIYRRAEASRKPKLLGEAGTNALMFLDNTLHAATDRCFYSVTAIDRAEPPNESSFSKEILFRASY